MTKRIGTWLWILGAALWLTGCGKQEAIQEVTTPTPAPIVEWKTKGFAVSEDVEEAQGLWIEKHIPWKHEDFSVDLEPEELLWSEEGGVFGEKIYRLQTLPSEVGDTGTDSFALEIYDTASMTCFVTEFAKEELLGEELQKATLVNMDVIGEQEYAFQLMNYKKVEEGVYEQVLHSLLYTEGLKREQVADVLPVYKELKIVKESYDAFLLMGDCICDSDGYSYARHDRKLYLMGIQDKEGQLVMKYEGDELDEIKEPFKTDTGELIFPIYSQKKKTTSFVWFDVEKKEPVVLAEVEDMSYLTQYYGMQGNLIYYAVEKGIVKWDIATGERKLIFRFDENGVTHNYNTMLVLREGKSPILRMYDYNNGKLEDWLVVLSEQKVEIENPIRITSLMGNQEPGYEEADRIENGTVIANRLYPDYHYTFETCEQGMEEDYRTKILAELAAGKGPDILYVSLEDMELLQSQDALLDLKQVLSQETEDSLLPGVLELGTADGTLVGVPMEISIQSMIVSERAWSEDTWTLEEVIRLMEEGTLGGGVAQGYYGCYSPIAVLMRLLECCMEDSFLIDWEKKECHFEDERFITLLECTKSCTDKVGAFEEGEDPLGQKGERIMHTSLLSKYNVAYYAGTKNTLDGHLVGYPGSQGNGNYLDAPAVLVVNKDTNNPQAVADYLECLLGEEVQNLGVQLSVLRVIPEDIVYYEDYRTQEQTPAIYINDTTMTPITVFEDGTTSLHEVQALLDKCVPKPRMYQDLEDIIFEEAGAYYEGDKSAEETAKLIDNRIQLYLDERY